MNDMNLIIKLIDIQEDLNAQYSGKEWKIISESCWVAAAEREFSEFLDEIDLLWKFWLPEDKLNFNADNALEELVDTLMFTISAFIIKSNKNNICMLVHNNYNKSYSFSEMLKYKQKMLNVDDKSGSIYSHLMSFIYSSLHIIDKSIDDLVEAYHKKYIKNIARLNAGYKLTGDKTGLE